jgi:Aminoglycoside-2''-adenylyltransferase
MARHATFWNVAVARESKEHLLSSSVSNHVPEPLARVADLMSTFGGMWSLCGGWAVDAWLGRQTRDHKDIDIAVFQHDLNVLLDHLAGWQLIAHDMIDPDSTEQWDGRRLFLPAHIHARHEGADLDFQVNERSGEDWLLSREPRIGLDLRRCAAKSVWRLPTLVPEVILFYKATAYFGIEGLWKRPHDDADFVALLPILSEWQRAWLQKAIAGVLPEHPWQAQLSP